MVQPWADEPFSLIPTSKVTKPTASKDAIYVADSMASAHNMLIRCLNSIYLQAPYVKEEADIQDLLQYSLFWERFIHDHHDGEETVFFPEIERVTGEKGIMNQNIEQHHAFQSGMLLWTQYTSECMIKGGWCSIFSEEIPTLLALDKYDTAGVTNAWHRFDKHMQSVADTASTYPLGMGSIDWKYEGGNKFPDLPFFVPYLVHYWYGRKYRSVWRFNPNTLLGEKRPLMFLPKAEEFETR